MTEEKIGISEAPAVPICRNGRMPRDSGLTTYFARKIMIIAAKAY
jgi:hypothetical protein